MWYTQGRGQVGPVLGAPDLGDGIGILFDSSAQDAQVSGDLLPVVPPTPSPSALCPGLRLLVASHTEQPCHPRSGHRQAHPLRAAWVRVRLGWPLPHSWAARSLVGTHAAHTQRALLLGQCVLGALSSELMTLPRAPLSLGPSQASSRAWDQGWLALLGNYSTESSIH